MKFAPGRRSGSDLRWACSERGRGKWFALWGMEHSTLLVAEREINRGITRKRARETHIINMRNKNVAQATRTNL